MDIIRYYIYIYMYIAICEDMAGLKIFLIYRQADQMNTVKDRIPHKRSLKCYIFVPLWIQGKVYLIYSCAYINLKYLLFIMSNPRANSIHVQDATTFTELN